METKGILIKSRYVLSYDPWEIALYNIKSMFILTDLIFQVWSEIIESNFEQNCSNKQKIIFPRFWLEKSQTKFNTSLPLDI